MPAGNAGAVHNAALPCAESAMPMPPILRLMTITLLCAAATATASAATGLARLQGAWQLQSGESVDGDGVRMDYARQGLAGTKVLADGRFAFTSTRNGAFWAAGSGTYEGDATRYLERPLMASYPLENGGSYEFRYTLEGDTWTLDPGALGRRAPRRA